MKTLFVDAFLVPVAEPDADPTSFGYDEARALNVLADGHPAVAALRAGETLTEVRGEQEDRDIEGDDGYATSLETLTKVAREGTDLHEPELMLGTETRQAPGEREDFCDDLDGGTHTAIKGEADDFARDDVAQRGWAAAHVSH